MKRMMVLAAAVAVGAFIAPATIAAATTETINLFIRFLPIKSNDAAQHVSYQTPRPTTT